MKKWILAFLMAFLLAPEIYAQMPDRIADRPPSQGPTQVKAGLYYIDISDIDGATETFSGTAYLDLEWNDPRLKFETTDPSKVRVYKPEEIWTPEIEVINADKLDNQEPPMCTVTPDGTVYYSSRIVVLLNTQMDLMRFPFDQQKLNFIVESSSRYGTNDLVFAPDPDQSGLGKDITSRGWNYSPLKWNVVAEPFAQTGQTYSRLVFSFGAERNSSYFIWKVLFPTAVFVFLTWSIFWIEVHDVQTALVISITILLTAVAFGNVTDSLLPKVGYHTWLDKFQLGSFVFIVGTVVETITVYGLHLHGNKERAVKVRKILRVLYPVGYALFCGILMLAVLR